MSHARPVGPDESDRGSALLLAIAFVVLIGALSAALASLVTSSVSSRVPLEQVRNRQYAADGAIEDAIAAVRSLPASAETCAPPAGHFSSELNDIAVRVDCTNAFAVVRGSDGMIVEQFNVIFSACLDTGLTCEDANQNVLVRAQVAFTRPTGAAATATAVQVWSGSR